MRESATGYHEALAQTKKANNPGRDAAMRKGNYTEAAKILGVHPNYLHRLIRNLELKEHLKDKS